MSTRKPALPPQSHIAIALAVTDVIADAPAADVDSLPTKVRESLEYFTEVASVGRAIAVDQAEALKEYRDDTALMLAETNADLDLDEAAALVDLLFSSHLMARLLADVAAGNIEPVATVAKTTKSAPKPDPKTVADPADDSDASTAKPAPKPGPKPAKKTAAPKAQPAPTTDAESPAADPVDDFADDPAVVEPTEPVSEPVLPPDPEEVPARAANRRSATPPPGVRPISTVVDDDDF